MKKSVILSALAASLMFGSAAQAAVQEFGPQSDRFKIDVAEGWSAKPTAEGVILSSKDEATALAVQVVEANGMTSRKLAEAIAAKLGGTNEFEESEGFCNVYNTDEKGVKTVLTIGVEDGKALVLTYSGTDMDAVSKMIDSIE